MKPSHRLWQALDVIPCGQAVIAEWRHRLGSDLESVQSLLRPIDLEAGVYPDLNGGGMPYRIVKHGADDFAAVPELGGETLALKKADVVVQQLDVRSLAKSIASALQLEACFEQLTHCSVWRVGSIKTASGRHAAVHLSLPCESSDVLHALESLNARYGQAAVLLVPTRRCIKPAVEALAQTTRGLVLALCDILPTRIDGQWAAAAETRDQLTTFLNPAPFVADEPLSERAQSVLIAMLELKADSSDRRQSSEQIASRALGASYDANSLKAVLSELKTRLLIDSKTGRGGGCWLTEAGHLRAEKLVRS
jgi:hypothetical protein